MMFFLFDVFSFLGRNQAKYKSEVNATLAQLEKYILFVNPFARHQRMAQFALDELSKRNVGPLAYPDSIVADRPEVDKFGESMVQFQRDSYAQMFDASTLVTESAFMAEAFLNLLIALFADPTLPENQDSHQFQEYLRSNRASKIVKLSSRCNYISGNPDLADRRYREAEKLFRLRNLIAHPYPDYKKLKTEQIWFFQFTPILKTTSPFPSYQMGVDQVMPTRDQALGAHKTAEEYIRFLEDLIDTQAKPLFDVLVRTNPLGWNEAKTMFSIPFGDSIVTPFVGLNPQ